MNKYPCVVCGRPSMKTCARCKKNYYCSKECQKWAWPHHKLVCTFDISAITPGDTNKPSVLLISFGKESFFDEINSHLINALKSRASISEATDATKLASIVSTVKPTAILITTAELAERKHSTILSRVVEYAKIGGTVIFCGMFSLLITPLKMDAMWTSDWNLPWKFGDYYRTTSSLNPSCTQRLQDVTGMPKSYSMKTVHLKGATRDAAVYVTTDESRLESHVWSPTSVHNAQQAPVLFTQIESGYVGYVGDFNAETDSTAVILGMCGLLG